MPQQIIKVGLKANAAFLFEQMKGNTLGGVKGEIYFHSIVYLNPEQFEQFKKLIQTFGGNPNKCLTKTKPHSSTNCVDYECYFMKEMQQPECPECDKLLKVSEDSNKIGEFLDWLFNEKKLHLTECRLDKWREGYYVPVCMNIEKLLAEYFNIDLNKAEKERQALLQYLREPAEDEK